MIQIKLLTVLILVILICHILTYNIVWGYWGGKRFLTEARKKELEAKHSEKRKVKIAPKFWGLIQEPIRIIIPLLFIIDGLILRIGILYSPYLSFFYPINVYLQIIGLIIQIIGLIIIFFGLILYLIAGKTITKEVYSKAIEERKMMTTGLYAYIRHPLYLSFILIPVGFLLISLNLLSIFYFMASTISTHPDEECDREGKFTFVTKEVRCEEEYMLKIYGKDYEEYMIKTGRLFPKLRK
ncbi:MAG: methyltransferase family protein [Promethearchaeota archaeon]|jgi:protein-S-isoprenylcysteine O-methyltransferase Ste14